VHADDVGDGRLLKLSRRETGHRHKPKKQRNEALTLAHAQTLLYTRN